MKIVTPNYDQVAESIQLGAEMHRESRFSFLDYDIQKLTELLATALEMPDQMFIRVAVHNDRVIGAMLGGISEYFFNHDLVASDLALFVTPEKRGTFAAQGLINAFVEWAEYNGVKEVTLGITTGVQTERTAKLYESMGFELAGPLYKVRV